MIKYKSIDEYNEKKRFDEHKCVTLCFSLIFLLIQSPLTLNLIIIDRSQFCFLIIYSFILTQIIIVEYVLF
jgi:hypothetical protein